jgi:hypothetical protein
VGLERELLLDAELWSLVTMHHGHGYLPQKPTPPSAAIIIAPSADSIILVSQKTLPAVVYHCDHVVDVQGEEGLWLQRQVPRQSKSDLAAPPYLSRRRRGDIYGPAMALSRTASDRLRNGTISYILGPGSGRCGEVQNHTGP